MASAPGQPVRMGEVGESSAYAAAKRSSESSRQYRLATATAPPGGGPLVTCGEGTGVGAAPTVAAGEEATVACEGEAATGWAPPDEPPQAASSAAQSSTAKNGAELAALGTPPGRA